MSARQSTAVPMKTVRKMPLRMTTLIDCIAAMPLAGVSRPSAAMMQTEKMKNNPAISPEPSAVRNSVEFGRSVPSQRFLPRFRLLPCRLRSRRSRAVACPSARLDAIRQMRIAAVKNLGEEFATRPTMFLRQPFGRPRAAM